MLIPESCAVWLTVGPAPIGDALAFKDMERIVRMQVSPCPPTLFSSAWHTESP